MADLTGLIPAPSGDPCDKSKMTAPSTTPFDAFGERVMRRPAPQRPRSRALVLSLVETKHPRSARIRQLWAHSPLEPDQRNAALIALTPRISAELMTLLDFLIDHILTNGARLTASNCLSFELAVEGEVA
jgi:hypothetical protein